MGVELETLAERVEQPLRDTVNEVCKPDKGTQGDTKNTASPAQFDKSANRCRTWAPRDITWRLLHVASLLAGAMETTQVELGPRLCPGDAASACLRQNQRQSDMKKIGAKSRAMVRLRVESVLSFTRQMCRNSYGAVRPSCRRGRLRGTRKSSCKDERSYRHTTVALRLSDTQNRRPVRR